MSNVVDLIAYKLAANACLPLLHALTRLKGAERTLDRAIEDAFDQIEIDLGMVSSLLSNLDHTDRAQQLKLRHALIVANVRRLRQIVKVKN